MAATKKLCPSIWLFAATIAAGIALLYILKRKEPFTNPLQQQLLQPPVDGNVANESLRKVLIYVENNPLDLTNFLNFMKASFFDPSAQFADPPNTAGIVSRYKNVFQEAVIKV